MISNVSGTFKKFSGNVQSENDDYNNAKIHFEVATDSIDTNLEERDNALKSPILLDTPKFPKMVFDGKLQKKNDSYQVTGDLTLCAITKSISLQAEFTGIGKGRFGDTRIGFEVDGKINRKDFGLTWTYKGNARKPSFPGSS